MKTAQLDAGWLGEKIDHQSLVQGIEPWNGWGLGGGFRDLGFLGFWGLGVSGLGGGFRGLGFWGLGFRVSVSGNVDPDENASCLYTEHIP